MARTSWRATATGELSSGQALAFSAVLGLAGSLVLWFAVNALTMWLTLATFIGYAVVYTVLLKPLTPQNIVIGGASGAMPPVLGWAAIRGDVGAEALILCLIIFLWTPPHFWALALYRADDYRRAGLPMLPVTHGSEFTRLHVFLYTLVLFAATLLPFVAGMSGPIYLAAAIVLGVMFSGYGWRLWRSYSDALARKTFRFSIVHLTLLFAALLVDHYLWPCRESEPVAVLSPALAGFLVLGRLRPPRHRRKPTSISPTSPAPRSRAGSTCPTPTAGCARWPTGRARWSSSSATRSAPTSARRRWPSWPRSESSLGADADRLQTVFVTIDPERDTPAVLKAYVANFGPGVVAPARQRRADGRGGQGVQGVLRQGARQVARQLHDGPQRRVVRVRPERQACACSCRTAATRRSSPPTSSCCSPPERRNGPVGAVSTGERGARKGQAAWPAPCFIFFIAATSIWRMRSALTPYSPARSCSVMPPELSSSP